MKKKIIFWFRNDLRLHDNPGLSKAAEQGDVIPVYIFDGSLKDPQRGKASRWFLHHSLKKLNEKLSGGLNAYKGNAQKIISKLVKDHAAGAVYASACYEPGRREQDEGIAKELRSSGIEVEFFNASLLWEPQDVLKEDGTPYKVFTPFYKNACGLKKHPRKPLEEPENLNLIKDEAAGSIDDLSLLDSKHPVSFSKYWVPGEDAALRKFKMFIEKGLDGYSEGRDFADKDQTSHLSPHLHFGEISPNYLWHELHSEAIRGMIVGADIDRFLTELGWREFSYSLLYNFPDLPRKNFNKKFDTFPWKSDDKLLHVWQQGRTGYPIVDAGMRQLLQTGYMHNRVRMVVASFLTKNLMQFWGHGANWFWDHLVDADLANNAASWQWVAGSGVDAAPFFRIFNPVTQGEKFDPTGSYIKKFVPELKNLPEKYLCSPWTAPAQVLKDAGIVLGKTYPDPMVSLGETRTKALAAYEKLRN